MDVMQRYMRVRLGLAEFAFNVAFGTKTPEGMDSMLETTIKAGGVYDFGAYIDKVQTIMEIGAVEYYNLRDIGKVVLQLAKPGQ